MKQSNVILNKFHEAPLFFDPTYKYDPNSNVYDTSHKIRIPAWCDRVLFQRDSQFKKELIKDPFQGDDVEAAMPLFYNRIEDRFSDHRPVIATYKVPVIKINRKKKEHLRNEILKKILGMGRVTKQALAESNQIG